MVLILNVGILILRLLIESGKKDGRQECAKYFRENYTLLQWERNITKVAKAVGVLLH